MDLDGTTPSSNRQQPEIYTVYARQTPFQLYRSQIETDSPNYFTAAFLSHDFTESSSRQLTTDRHPQLFALIVEHLSGYDILPLEPSVLPRFMSPEVAIKNLRKDADYFGLDSLVQAIDLQLDLPTIPVPFPPSLAKEHGTTSILDFDRFVGPGADLKVDADIDDWKIHVVGMEGTHLYRRQNVIVRLTLQENETEGPGSILPNGDDRMEPIVVMKVHGRDPPMASSGRSGSSIPISPVPMFISELDTITINGSATTGTELVSVLAGSLDDVASPKWIRDLVKCRRDHALGFHEEDNETWHSMVRGSVVPSFELIADELIVLIDVAERTPRPNSVTDLLNCRYAYASLRTMDKRASEWEQAIKAVDSRP